MRKNVIVYSIPFGFGPTGKAIVIANELARNHSVTLITYQHSLQITTQIEYVEILDCQTRNFFFWDTKIFEKTDVLISIMDLRLLDFVAKKFPNIKTVFVDSLFWWRKSLSDLPFDSCSLFILQSYPGVTEKLKEVPAKFISKFYEVGPILSANKAVENESQETDSILLHFGGVNSLIAQWEMYKQYFEFITSIVIKYAKTHKCILIVTGNIDLMTELKHCFQFEENTLFQCLDNGEFHKTLSKTKLFISTCGIEATYEAFAYQIPTIFLPPVNSTQLYQLMCLISLQFPVVITESLVNNFKKVILANHDYRSETIEIARVLECLVGNPSERVVMQTGLYSFIDNAESKENREKMLLRQNDFLNKGSNKWTDVLYQAGLLK